MVKGMPTLLKVISVIGTAAMLWVGGSIIVHGLEALGWHWPYDTIHHIAAGVAHAVATAEGFVKWLVTATLDGVLGFLLGLMLIPFVNKVLAPTLSVFFPEKQAH